MSEMSRSRTKSFFSPPLYKQRHQFVIEFIKTFRPKTVLDLGCSDCSLLRKLRFHRHSVELLAGVDIDSAPIRQNMHTLAPLVTEYLQPNSCPLTINLYQGSITETEACTVGFDLITCIEVIEHLQLWEVERFSEVLFDYMKPRTVIISTPNAEFNSLLPGLTSGFRHKDHKFEWSRAQFQTWGDRVCRKYNYSVEFTGVGEAPAESRDVGFCSQIGVFRRVADDLNGWKNNAEQEPSQYELLYRVVYPSLSDNSIFQRTLIGEVLFQAEQLKQAWLEAQEAERCEFTPRELLLPSTAGRQAREEVYRQGSWVCVPLSRVWAGSAVRALCGHIQLLRDTLLADTQVQLDAERDAVMLPFGSEKEKDDEEETEEVEKKECMSRCVNDDVEEDWETELRNDF